MKNLNTIKIKMKKKKSKIIEMLKKEIEILNLEVNKDFDILKTQRITVNHKLNRPHIYTHNYHFYIFLFLYFFLYLLLMKFLEIEMDYY